MLEHKGGDIPALFLALVIAGVVSYLIAQKWKSTLAKKEKIKMLVVLAAEEAARVELMSKSEYTAAAPRHHCAICLNPATTRCSRCKATRYCSGKCQIIHWRQGHRQECQQPDIHNSSTASCASSTNWEPNSTVSFSEAPELRSSEPDLWVPRTTAPAAQKLVPSNTEAPKFSALEAQQISMLKSEPIVNGEISYLKGVNMTGSVPDTTHASNNVTKSLKSCDHLSMCSSAATSPTKDAPMYDIPLCKSSGTDVPISCSASPSILLSSDISGSRDTIADIPLTQILVPDSLTNLINGIPRSKLSKTDISSSESHTHGGSKRFEHDLQSSVKPIHDLPSSGSQTFDFPVCTSLDVTSSNSKSPVCCLSATKGVLFHFTGSKNHAVDESRIRTVVPDIPNDGAVPDASSCRSSLSDISSSESSLPNSPRLEHSVSTKSSSKSSLLINHDGPACCASKIQNPMPNEWRTGMSASTIESPRTSVSNTVRSFGASLQHPSPHRAVACVCTISCQMTDSLNAVFSNEACTNGLKRSGKKAAHLPKSSKTSKQTTVVTVNKSLSKPGKMLFPYEYFVKLFSWDDLELPPCGLINCGNSCYANVVLQCLTYTRPLAAYLLQQSHSKECRIKDWCLMCEFEHLISRVRAGESPLSPIRILSQIQNIGNHLGYGSQEDAHEFLRFVINTMQSICLDEAGGEKAVDSRMQETTFIQQIFGGYLQSKVMCMRCQHESDRYENMMDLTVEIHGNVESLEDALSQFTAPELLDGENKYKCDRCKAYVKARKQLAVHEAPNILTIALKRFQTGKFGKLNKCVTFPDVLDMTPYMSGTSDKPPLYKLYAVVVHIDMLNASFFGHYVCYVKNFQGNWYKIDDSEVKPVELDGVMSEGAYMLLYSRTSPRHLNLTIDRIIETRTTVTVNHCAHEAEQSLLLDRHDERFDVGATQLSSLDSIACATIEGSPATIGNLSQYENGRDPCGVIHMNAFGYNCDRLPLIARDGYVDSISREYSDLISSDAGSLFSGSDEASCSTDSNRDSTSTVDYAETLFGESGSVECSSTSGWAEASFGAFHSGFCLKSSPCPPQSKCFYGNDMFSLDSSFSNQRVVGNTHLGKRRLDQGFSPLPDPPPPLATDRLPVQFSNSANSAVCHPFVSSSPLVNDYSDPSSRHGNKLDCSLRNTDRNVRLLQSQNSINVPDVSETGAYLNDSRQDFAVPAKRQYIRAKSISEILEADKVCLDVPSRSYNMASNFECSFVQDTRKSCSATVHSLGFER